FLASMGLVLWFGTQKVYLGELSLGTFTSFLAFMSILQQPVRQIGMLINSFSRAASCGERLFTILNHQEFLDENQEGRKVDELGTLEFKKVSFSFPGENQHKILEDINLRLEPGTTLGIIGPQGSGKSTLAQLIPRFYDPTSGKICFNGVDLKDYQLKTLRDSVSLVQQDTFLFTSTVKHNVLYGEPWAAEDEVIAAASRAQLHEHINHLPKAYQTLIGERGLALSGGQRQRLNISRSLILNTKILIFDDSTSAIDAATEQKIRLGLKEGARDRITLIVSHRLASLMHADQIIYLEDGKITEQGTHEELIQQGGHYSRIYHLQTKIT
ncbi:MAG: ABC transporter ATP-binding protein/permease, partial [SAR324 cluster bacterium]|nr:ABC transporter ATP-binding protein/permease [SAR324 cluster bacterium]